MIKDTDLISVRNRNNGDTGYMIPDRHIIRDWHFNETKKIPFEELRAFSYMPGGQYTLKNLLVIENEEAIELLLNEKVEPEYFYNEDKIKDMLLTASIDEFADFLDFAPSGAIEMAKSLAVSLEVPDTRKREMLSKKTGLNINNAIMVNHVMEEETEEVKEEAPKRRVAITEEKAEPKKERKTATPKYNVVEK